MVQKVVYIDAFRSQRSKKFELLLATEKFRCCVFPLMSNLTPVTVTPLIAAIQKRPWDIFFSNWCSSTNILLKKVLLFRKHTVVRTKQQAT